MPADAPDQKPRNLGGRPLGSKTKYKSLRELAVKHNKKSIDVLVALCQAEDETVRLKAATQLTVLAEGLPGRRTAPPEPDEGAARLTPEQIAAMMGDS